MSRFKVDHIRGFRRMKKKFGRKSANRLEEKLDRELEQGIRRMARTSFELAPVLTGALRESILRSPKKDGHLQYIYGSTLPYAQRQEYEHKTKRGYFRKSVKQNKAPVAKEIANMIKGHFR